MKNVIVEDGPGNTFILAGINNRQQYTASVCLFEIIKEYNTLVFGQAYVKSFRDNLADFEVTVVGSDSIVMIVGVEYELQAHAYLLKVIG